MTTRGSTPSERGRARWLVAAMVAAGLIGAGVYYFRPNSPPSRPRPAAPLPPLTASPFENTRPGVAYVGDQACVGCHRDYAKSYRQHPMGQSMFHAGEAPAVEEYHAKANNPFQVGGLHFEVVRQGAKTIHREWCQDAKGNVLAQVDAEVNYVVGSGAQARSYLLERDGFLFQSPITWYVDKAQWHLSPGYDKNMQHFQRRIEPRCLYCHAQQAFPVEHAVNQYEQPVFGQLAIGCERCHGPGELHVAGRKKGLQSDDTDFTIVNPRRLSPLLREAVCEQCHLQGEAIVPRRGRAQTDYRPGLALHEIVSIFVRPPEARDDKLIVGHVEQMQQSVCYTKSAGQFGCTSCHDPHRAPAPAEKLDFYRDRCRQCHLDAANMAQRLLQNLVGQDSAPVQSGQERSPDLQFETASLQKSAPKAPDCSLPQAERTAKTPRDNCLTCHMPRQASSVASHLAVTDHRVLRRPDRPRKARGGPGYDGIPLVAFHRPEFDPKDEELLRDLAIGVMPLVALAHEDGAEQVSAHLSRRAIPLLEKAVARAPDDVPALEALGYALFARGDGPERALRPLDDALALAPDREQTLTWAAHVAQAGGRLDLAASYARRLTEKYPRYAGHHERLANIHVSREDWPRALHAVRTALEIDPFRAEARELLIAIHLATGNRTKAQAEFDALGILAPELQQRIRPWFAKQMQK